MDISTVLKGLHWAPLGSPRYIVFYILPWLRLQSFLARSGPSGRNALWMWKAPEKTESAPMNSSLRHINDQPPSSSQQLLFGGWSVNIPKKKEKNSKQHKSRQQVANGGSRIIHVLGRSSGSSSWNGSPQTEVWSSTHQKSQKFANKTEEPIEMIWHG